MHKWSLMIVILAGLVTMGGCDTVKSPETAGPDPLTKAAYPRVAAPADLGKYLYWGQPVVERGNEQTPMHVEVPVRLRSDKAVRTQYRFIFFDEKGMPLRPIMEWRYHPLQPRTQTWYAGQATDPAAADWNLEVRPAH